MAKERRVKKVQARHILVGSKELAEELKVKTVSYTHLRAHET